MIRKSVSTACFVASIAAVTLAGCGGSVSSTRSSASSHTGPAPKQTATAHDPPAKHARSAKKLHATIYNPNAGRKSSGKKASADADIPVHTAASRQNPCTLVSASEAGALLHAEVQRETEAPLGPTCVLQFRGERQSITFTLEEVNIATQIRKMRQKPSQLTIDGRAAYCGRLGAPLLYVKLSGGRALKVTAPCAAARALAARALPRIRA